MVSMVSNSEAIATDFWYEFDNFFHLKFKHVPSDMIKAIRTIRSFDLLGSFMTHFYSGDMIKFKLQLKQSELEQVRHAIKIIADNHLRIVNEHFKNPKMQQNAFEYFGQGVLFDDKRDETGELRRPAPYLVHMMDTPPGMAGYLYWHVFVRAAVYLETAGKSDDWLSIDRHIALAAHIHSKQNPRQSDINGNKPDPPNRWIEPHILADLRASCLDLTFEEIDDDLVQLIVRH
jgi:hypothetical protein